MGSTLEILSQFWASICGGYFFDPHQNTFCNAIHLYLWLFLLVTPFVSFLYFPEALTTWGLYVLSTLIVITAVKLLNLALHVMYDEAQIVSDTSLKKSTKNLRQAPTDEDGGIEMQVMQVLGDPSSRTSAENNISNDLSQANSAISIDFPEQMTSTIDLKVDVHRKNSSESSESIGAIGHSQKPFSASDAPLPKESNRRSLKIKSKSEETPATTKRSPTSDDSDIAKAEEVFDQIRDIRQQQKARLPSKYRRQLSIHSEQTGMGLVFSGESAPSLKLQRHRSSEANEEHRHNRHNRHDRHNQGFYHKSSHQLQSVPSDLRYYIRADEEKQKLGLNQPNVSMRKDSNSTMSAIQLSTVSGPSSGGMFSSSTRLRRHSTTTGKPSMRRIKSAALETCCAQPSVSNLSAHPNSVETIGGQTLINPQHAVLPPPSKSLIRNQHSNLYSKDNPLYSCTKDNQSASKNTSQIIEPVYPIAEQADERCTNDCFMYNSGSDDDDEDDEDDEEEEDDDDEELPDDKRQRCSTTSESDIDRPPTQSTDSDTENNGSRSPLLDMKTRNESTILPPTEKKTLTQPEKLKKSSPSEEEAIATATVLAKSENAKGEDSGCPSSDCASASSKDLLLTQDTNESKKQTERMWFDFSMDSNNISVDVTDPGEGSSKMVSGTTGKEPKNLGAIPKTSVGGSARKHQSRDRYYDEVDEIIRNNELSVGKTSSHTSSAASSSRCSGASYEYERPPIDVLHETGDGCGWILQSALSNNPILAAARGDPPPLLPVYNSRQSSMFPVARPPGTFLNRTRHHPPMIRRETRGRPQNSSFDTTVSSRDEENSSRVVSGWEYDNFEMQHSINADILLKQLMEHNKTNLSDIVQQAEGSIPISEFSESVFRECWRHYTLPPEKPVQPKRFYKFPFHCFGKHELKISMDRLQLLAMFDRDLGWFPAILAIILASLVSILGSIVLRLNIYKDIFAFIFCFVIAGSQYSLLKSVQPDAASPIHGFNKTVAYSRPIYFCLCSSLLILANHLISDTNSTYGNFILFNIPIAPNEVFRLVQYMMSMILLMMPIFFSLGLFPQINTFLIYMLEQIDMHLLGGNAVCSLLSAFLGVLRSMLACFILYGPVFGGLSEPRGSQHILFSIFCALLIAISYHMSRSASDFSCIWSLIKSSLFIHTDDDDDDKEPSNETEQVDLDHKKTDSETQPVNVKGSDSDSTNKDCDLEDPLPRKLQSTVNSRLKNDFLVCIVMGVLVFSLHCTTVFTVLQPELLDIICKIAAQLGFVLHYFVPQMRKHLPWLCVAQPVLKQDEFGQFEARNAAKIMWFEKTYVCICFFERNILYPLLFLSALTENSTVIAQKFGVALGSAIIVVCGLKCVRSSYSDPSSQYIIVLFSVLLFGRDFTTASETFLVDYFIVAIIYKKISEFLLKFIVTYIAPWQITWGSAFHAFAQPFSVPHSAMLFLQAGISALLSTPLNPFLGSAIFLTSYVRPIKFWERDYNTRRIDHSNTRLVSQLERDLGADDNNLNSIFYEHLTRSLQHSLCGDLLLGRWGNVSQGDCFVLASDYLNCLVHVIELGNGLCTFQMRGLEFRGTYCQQREVEAISEGVEENEGCCCCSPGHIPHLLSMNAMFSTRWLAWQVVQSKYILEGYSISDNLAQATLQVFEFRRVLITYYIKSIIFYTIRSPKLEEWLESSAIQDSLQHTLERQFVDLDPIFNHNLDADFENRASGITRASFCDVYMDWIEFCCMKRAVHQQAAEKTENQPRTTSSTNVSKGPSPWSSNNPTPSPRDNDKPVDGKNNNVGEANNRRTIIHTSRDSPLISLLLALGLLARRTLATASNSSLVTNVEFFLHGLHALFKGDFRITSPRDEWVFADMDLLHSVVAPAVKMALKLHQDHFLSPEEYDEAFALYDAITTHSRELVISHEADPLWRNAVLRGAPNLLALRHVMEDGSDEYRLIRLTKRFLSFRVIKLNRECVRGLWAGQQQELIYLRNRNPERGSIQNAKQALRNIINSSCDQPIGYPIYVSPLTTSYAETNEQLNSIVGGAITLEKIHKMVVGFCQRVRQRCREGCSSGSATLDTEADIQGVYCNAPTPNNTLSGTTGTLSYGSQSLSGAGNRGSLASMGKPTNSALFANLLNRERERDRETERDSIRERGTKRRSSGIAKAERDNDRRATLPATATGSSDRDLTVKEIATGDAKSHPNANESYVMMTSFLKPNSSFSSGHLGARNTSANSRNVCISMDRKSKSEERQSSRERIGGDSEQLAAAFSPPHIEYQKKVIIVDSSEIYDCLDLGRRIDVVWPNEMMRLCGGRSSWADWKPQEGMVGYVVHYWVPNHPDNYFRSNFNRTLFLIQIGDKYVPVGENGVKEYNTVGSDERIKIVHMPKEELKLDVDEHDILEEKSEGESVTEDYVLSADHSA